MKKKYLMKSAFSLMEMMVVLLIVAIVAAASAPMVTKKLSSGGSVISGGSGNNPWTYIDSGKSIIFNSKGKADQHVYIGEKDKNAPFTFGRLNIDSNETIPHLTLTTDKFNPVAIIADAKNHRYALAQTSANGNPATIPSGTVAMGDGLTLNKNAVAIGVSSSVGEENSVAIGNSASAQSKDSTSVGKGAVIEAKNPHSIAIGSAKINQGDDAGYNIAIGNSSYIHYKVNNGIVLGPGASIGTQISANNNTANSSIVIGNSAEAKVSSKASSNNSIVIGTKAKAEGSSDAIVLGTEAKAEDGASDAILIGKNRQSGSSGSISIGTNQKLLLTQKYPKTGDNSIAIGNGASASGNNSIAIGQGIISTTDDTITIGTGTRRINVADGYISISGGGNTAISMSSTGGSTPANGQLIYSGKYKQWCIGGKDDLVYIPGTLVVDGVTITGLGLNGSKTSSRFATGDSNGNFSAHYSTGFESLPLTTFWANFKAVLEDHGFALQNIPSDRRLKNVGEKFTGGLEELKKLDLYHFTFKKDEKKTPHVGVMAQDLQKVFPNAVTKGDDGYLRIRWDEMFYSVINAVKELDNKIAGLVEKVKSNTDEITSLKTTVKEQQKVINAQEEAIKDLTKRLEKLEKKS